MASPLSWLKRCWVDQALSVKPVRRHKLGVQLLEDRVVPANVDVFYNVGYGPYADLQFQGNFPATTPQTTTVTSTSAVTAGFYVPGGEVKGNFVPFFSFPNGLTLSNLSFSNSNNSFFGTVTISTQVMAAILSNGSQTTNQTLVDTGTGNPYLFTMSDLVNDTDIKIPNADAVPFQIGGQTFVPGDFFVNYSTSSGHTYDSAYLSLGGFWVCPASPMRDYRSRRPLWPLTRIHSIPVHLLLLSFLASMPLTTLSPSCQFFRMPTEVPDPLPLHSTA